MQNNKDIRSYNHKGPHGYWESYFDDGTLYYKCFFVNDVEYGYEITFNEKLYYAR